MGTWWVTSALDSGGGPAFLIAWIIWVIGAIVLHELAHGWAALACGDDTPRVMGHMTWNPIVHMGWASLLLFAILGIAWGAMPVNPSRFKGRYDDALVALAGPMMNVALALACILACGLWLPFCKGVWFSWGASGFPPALAYNVYIFLSVGAMLNIALALFNLLPIPPLDGSRVLATFFPGPMGAIMNSEIGRLVIVIFMILAFTGAMSFVFDLAEKASSDALRAVLRVTMPSSPWPPQPVPPPSP